MKCWVGFGPEDNQAKGCEINFLAFVTGTDQSKVTKWSVEILIKKYWPFEKKLLYANENTDSHIDAYAMILLSGQYATNCHWGVLKTKKNKSFWSNLCIPLTGLVFIAAFCNKSVWKFNVPCWYCCQKGKSYLAWSRTRLMETKPGCTFLEVTRTQTKDAEIMLEDQIGVCINALNSKFCISSFLVDLVVMGRGFFTRTR